MNNVSGLPPPDGLRHGHIKGFRLPGRAWDALRRDNILTFELLREIAPRIERIVPGIGKRVAQMIRDQLARAEA